MLKTVFSSIFVLLSLNFSFAQDALNIVERGNWDDSSLDSLSGLIYNDVWGYVDEVGNEYAIMGSLDFTHFFDINDPENLVEVERIAGRSRSIWRDFKTYLHYGYGVADNGGASLQIFDLSGLPNTVTKVFETRDFFTNCHNIFIDEKNARLYAVGTSVEDVVVLDLSTSPANPTLLKNIDLGDDTDRYIHDVYVRDHIAYASHVYDSRLHIYDFSDVNNPQFLGGISEYTQPGLNHSSWVSDDGNTMVMADENRNAAVKVVDVSNINNPVEIATFKSTLEAPVATNSIAHNPFIVGNDYVVLSYYHEGLQVYDISNPANPTRAGYFDTEPRNTNYSGSIGSWGAFPFLPSGNVLASDIKNGLFVVQPTFDLGYCRKHLYTAHTVETGVQSNIVASESISLRNGFIAESGSIFSAIITACQAPALIAEAEEEFDNYKEVDTKEAMLNPLINKELKELSISVFPNPTSDFLRVEWADNQGMAEQNLFLISSEGKIISTQKESCGLTCWVFQLSDLPRGVYFLMIGNGNNSMLAKKVFKLD